VSFRAFWASKLTPLLTRFFEQNFRILRWVGCSITDEGDEGGRLAGLEGNAKLIVVADDGRVRSSVRYVLTAVQSHLVVNTFCTPQLHQKCSPYTITERSVPELMPVLGSQPAGDVTQKPGGRLPLLSARPAVTPATLKRAATSSAAW